MLGFHLIPFFIYHHNQTHANDNYIIFLEWTTYNKVKRVEFEDLFHLAIFFAYISGLAFPHFF